MTLIVDVLEKVKRGLERAETEGAVNHEDAKASLGKWLALAWSPEASAARAARVAEVADAGAGPAAGRFQGTKLIMGFRADPRRAVLGAGVSVVRGRSRCRQCPG